MSVSPTMRTLKALRERGLTPWIVERSIPKKPHSIKVDAYHFIDLLAISKAAGIIGVQSCGQGFSEHVKKIKAEPLVIEWLQSGGKAELWGWRKVKKKRGGKAMVWKPRIADILTDGKNIEILERKA